MSETKFTKGNWVCTKPKYSNGFWYVDKESGNDSGEICVLYGKDAKENAHLIATAPEMYEMLNHLTSMSSEDAKLYIENSTDIVDLLAKARGE